MITQDRHVFNLITTYYTLILVKNKKALLYQLTNNQEVSIMNTGIQYEYKLNLNVLLG